MSEATYDSAADVCRANSWKPGQLFNEPTDVGFGRIWELTAIGEKQVLVIHRWSYSDEGNRVRGGCEEAFNRFERLAPIDRLPWESRPQHCAGFFPCLAQRTVRAGFIYF